MTTQTRKEQIIAIAYDVLEHLNAGRHDHYRVAMCSYLSAKTEGWRESLRVEDIDNKCYVCALGACLLSKLRLFENSRIPADCVTKDMIYGGTGMRISIGQPRVVRTLLSIFTKSQLILIERAYEGQGIRWYDDPVPDEAEPDALTKQTAAAFGHQYINKIARLRAIMENIIDNDGVFIP